MSIIIYYCRICTGCRAWGANVLWSYGYWKTLMAHLVLLKFRYSLCNSESERKVLFSIYICICLETFYFFYFSINHYMSLWVDKWRITENHLRRTAYIYFYNFGTVIISNHKLVFDSRKYRDKKLKIDILTIFKKICVHNMALRK